MVPSINIIYEIKNQSTRRIILEVPFWCIWVVQVIDVHYSLMGLGSSSFSLGLGETDVLPDHILQGLYVYLWQMNTTKVNHCFLCSFNLSHMTISVFIFSVSNSLMFKLLTAFPGKFVWINILIKNNKNTL